MIVISFGHCSFDQLKMLNHSLTAQGTNLPFSHKSTVSTMNEQNIICNKMLICRQLFAGQVMGFRPVEKERKIYQMIICNYCASTINLAVSIFFLLLQSLK